MDLDVKLNINKLMSSPNIVDMLDERALNTLGYRVINEFNLDKESRIQWEKRVENAMKLALQVSEAKSFPWTNASNIKFPLVTIAALQFHSRAYPALIPGNDIIKVDYDIPGDTDPQALADVINRNTRVEKHMSFQLLKEDECWEGEMDKVLITVPIVGCAFKKTYWDFNEDHPVSENVLAKDFVVSYWTKNLKDCNRQSHVLYLSVNDVLSRQRRGIWTDDFKIRPQQTIQEDDLSQAQDQAQGVYQPQSDPGTPFEFIEQHRWEDLDGDGFKEPYIITVHKDTRKVVRVVANYFENSIKKNNKGEILSIKPESYFTKYSFIPSPDGGFYDIGFGILLGPLNESINTIINQLVDAGTMANTAGGFLARGIKIRGGNYNFAPMEWKHVDSTGDDLAKGIYPLPVREPSQVLFTLLQTLVTYGERIVGSTDIMVGENVGQNTPAETARTMAEQGQKVFAGIFKRIYRALNEEVRKIYRLNQLYLPEQVKFMGNAVLAADYQPDPTDIRPAADPHVVSDVQRIMQAETLKQTALSVPGFNVYNVMKRYLEALKVPNIEQVLPDPTGPNAIPGQPDVKIQIEQMKAEERKLSIETKFKLGIAKLQAEAEVNKAKIAKLEAEAAYIAEDTTTIKQDSHVNMVNSELNAAKAKQDGFLKSIELMMKATEGAVEYDSDARRVLGLGGESSNQSPDEVPTQ